MKVILDVNIWISALLWRGVPGQILDLADRQEIAIFVSDEILQELGETLSKPKLQDKIKFLKTNKIALIQVVQQLSERCSLNPLDVPDLRDPDDTIILATALAADADVIITGDLDLLSLNKFRDIPILNPTDFLNCYIKPKES